jgi:hypothetical protein
MLDKIIGWGLFSPIALVIIWVTIWTLMIIAH